MALSESDGRRLAAFGGQLLAVHGWLRGELARLHTDLDDHLDGGAPPRPLRAHCLAFCAAVRRHHTGEDDTAFPVLAARFPELRPVLAELTRDHHVVADAMRALADLLDGMADRPGPAEGRRLRAELDGLSAVLESHLTYEERRIIAALDALPASSWPDGTPDFLRTDDTGASAG